MNKATRTKPLVLSFLLILLFSIQALEIKAQKRKLFRGFWQLSEEYDENVKFHVGVFHTTTIYNYVFDKNPIWDQQIVPVGDKPHIGKVNSISARNGVGTNIFGFVFDYKVNSVLNVSASFLNFPMFQQQSLVYVGDNGETNRYQKQALLIEDNASNFFLYEVPLHLKIRSEHKYLNNSKNSYKLYLLGGAKYSRHINANSYYDMKNKNGEIFDPEKYDVPIIVKPSYLSYEIGLGGDIIFKYFKVSPEIKFSESIGNLLYKNHDNAKLASHPNVFMNALDRLRLRSLQFGIIIE